MTELGGAIQQQTYTVASDGTTRTVAMNRSGGLVVSSPQAMYDQWLRAGKVFEAHFATEGGTATVENNTAVDLTEPFFRATVPSSKICVPIMIKVQPAVVWETGDEVIAFTSDTDTYNAGGAAPDIRNMAAVSSVDSSLGSSALTNVFDGDSVLTEDALTNPRIFDSWVALTGGLHVPYEYNILKGNPPIFIHGESSWGIAIARTTTTVEVYYNVIWAELDKNELVNS